jgi:hypothetical protein
MATCRNGHTIPEGSRFCPECGAPTTSGWDPGPPGSTQTYADAEESPPKQTSRVPIATLVVIGIAVLLIVGAVLFFRGGGHTITGTMTLISSDLSDSCQGSGGYDDIGPGTAVTVRNGEGETIGTGRLGEGTLHGVIGCTYPFEIDVPDEDFYRVEVSHRGELEFSKDEMEQNDWTVDASLG